MTLIGLSKLQQSVDNRVLFSKPGTDTQVCIMTQEQYEMASEIQVLHFTSCCNYCPRRKWALLMSQTVIFLVFMQGDSEK